MAVMIIVIALKYQPNFAYLKPTQFRRVGLGLELFAV